MLEMSEETTSQRKVLVRVSGCAGWSAIGHNYARWYADLDGMRVVFELMVGRCRRKLVF